MVSAVMRRVLARSWYVVFVVAMLQVVAGVQAASAQSLGCARVLQLGQGAASVQTISAAATEFAPGDVLNISFMDDGLGAAASPRNADMVQMSPRADIGAWFFRHVASDGIAGAFNPITPAGYLSQNGLYLRMQSGTNFSRPVITCGAPTPTQPVVVTQAPSHDGVIEVPFLHSFAAAGGTGSYTYAITGGVVPPGLRLEADGRLVGEPTTPGDYSFTVTATDSANATGSDTYTLRVRMGNPGQPTSVVAVAGDGEALVYFDAPQKTGGQPIAQYEAYASTGQSGSSPTSPLRVTGLTNGEPVYFMVWANNGANVGPESDNSNTVTPIGVQVIDFPAPGEQALNGTLAMPATTDRGLLIAYATTTPQVCDLSSSHQLQMRSIGTCTITASQDGNAGYSPAQSVTHTFEVRAALPGAPRIFGTTIVSATEVSVNFGAPLNNGGSPILGYDVVAWPGGVTASGESPPIRVAGLQPDTSYTFIVSARNAAGSGPGSDATTPITTPAIAKVLGVGIQPGRYFLGQAMLVQVEFDRTVFVTGQPRIVLDVGGLTRHATYFNGNGGTTIGFWYFPQLGDQDDDGVTVESLELAGGTIRTIGTTTDAETVLRGITADNVFVGPVVPDAPTITSVTAGDAEATLTFDAPFVTGGASIEGYTVTASPGGMTLDVSASPATMTGLSNGTSYTLTVAARNSAGTGAPSAPSAAVLPKAVQFPQEIDFPQPEAQRYTSRAPLAAFSSSGLPVTLTSQTPQVCSVGPQDISFETVGTCVLHADQAGDSTTLPAPRVTRSFRVLALEPRSPTTVRARLLDADSVEISFVPPSDDGGSPITGYDVYANMDYVESMASTVSPLVIRGLAKGVQYTFTLVARNADEASAHSVPSNPLELAGAPLVRLARAPDAGRYTAGQTLSYTLWFDQDVLVIGVPRLELQIGTQRVLAPYAGTAAGSILRFDYPVQPGDEDHDGVEVIGVLMEGARIRNLGGLVPDLQLLPAFEGAARVLVGQSAAAAPTISQVDIVDGAAVVHFAPPIDVNDAGVLDYMVLAQPSGVIVIGTGSPITVNGLDARLAHTFIVRMRDVRGGEFDSLPYGPVSLDASQTITFADPGTVRLRSSVQLQATASSGWPVQFTAGTPQVCSIESDGRLRLHAVGTCTVHADQTTATGYTAAPRVSRTFEVKADVPGAPFIYELAMGELGRAEVTFSAPESDGGSAVTEYILEASPSGRSVRGTASPLVMTGLPHFVPQVFTVTAVNAEGRGEASLPSNPFPVLKAPTVVNLTMPSARHYAVGETLQFLVYFDKMLRFYGPVRLGLTVGGQPRIAGVVEERFYGTGSVLVFEYTVAEGDFDGDGIRVDALIAAPDALRDQFGIPANLDLNGFGTLPGVVVGTETPSAPGNVRVFASNGQATLRFDAPSSSGRSPITGYKVVAQPGNIVATGPHSPLVVDGLTNGIRYDFTVVAVNAQGEGEASAVVSDTPFPTIDAEPVALDVPYGTASIEVPLVITGGTPTAIRIVTQPSHGTLTVDGIRVHYHPTPGYSGVDTFTYSASGVNFATAAATVTITIGAAVQLETDALSDAVGSTAYRMALAARGGVAPYAYVIASGTLPPGLTLSATGELSGTPTAAGRFTFEVEVSDSTVGTPLRVRRSYMLVVAAPQIVTPADALPEVIQSDDVSQRLQVSGGAAPYAFRLMSGALPHGVTLAEDGALTGTATEAGTFDFEVEVTDANGFTAVARYRMQVAQSVQVIRGFVADPGAPIYSEGGTFALAATGGASGLPVVFASTTPDVCSVSGNTVTMLAAGRCTLTADQAGDGNHQAAVQQRLDVDIAMAVPVLVWETELTHLLGEGSFELPLPTSPSPGAFTFESSDTAVASVDGRTVTIHGEGTAVITVRQAASGSYAAARMELRLVIAARPDPTRDADVTGLLQAQVDASVRFASAQQSNIRDRLRQVRAGDNAGSNTVNLSNGNAGRSAASLPVGQLAGDGAALLPKGWGSWAAGTATYGRGGAQRDGRYDLRTDGLTVGVDRALGERVLFGLAGSIGRNDSELQDSDSEMRADQRSLALYGLWRAGEHVFVDGMLATGSLEFDLRRWSRDADAMGVGSRDGNQWFGSLGLGYEQAMGALRMTGYGRYDASRSTLDAYREQGLGAYDLAYGRHVVENRALAVGLEGSLQPTGDARVRPFWSVEYRHALQDRGTATLNYAQWAHAQDYAVGMRSYNDNALSLSAGMDIRLQRGWMLSLLLGHEQTRASSESSSIGLRLSSGGQSGAVQQPLEQQAMQPAAE